MADTVSHQFSTLEVNSTIISCVIKIGRKSKIINADGLFEWYGAKKTAVM